MRERGQWDGVLAIARFNWPWYLAAVASVWFLAGSLAASHWIYDRSDLYRFHWLERAIGTAQYATSSSATPASTSAPPCSPSASPAHAGACSTTGH